LCRIIAEIRSARAERVFVLHAFQKKSKSGIATPKSEIELIKQRLKQAIEISKKKE
jgi:phage-related protein